MNTTIKGQMNIPVSERSSGEVEKWLMWTLPECTLVSVPDKPEQSVCVMYDLKLGWQNTCQHNYDYSLDQFADGAAFVAVISAHEDETTVDLYRVIYSLDNTSGDHDWTPGTGDGFCRVTKIDSDEVVSAC